MYGDLPYFVAFSLFPGIGPMRFTLLTSYFGSAKAAWEAPLSELKHTGLGLSLCEAFDVFRKRTHPETYVADLAKRHIGALMITDTRYPPLLRQIPDAPFVLYVKGRGTKINLEKAIGVVGTRNITPYGKQVTRRLVTDLVKRGYTIVSGLALGVDTVAHQAAIDAGGKTIAVLGCGIDIVAPSGNATLYRDIVGGCGAIVSEMPLGLRPDKGLFVTRNRIISGLSLGVVVTQGAEDSGALITARYAAEQGRDVFAVPGPITSKYSRATSVLLKNGAKLVESVNDIMEEISSRGPLAEVQGGPL